MARKHKVWQQILLLVLTIMFIFSPSVWAAEPLKVAIVPFTMNAEKDLSFLRNGIRDMLASRLALEGEIVVVEAQKTRSALSALGDEAVNQASARKLGEALGADYVLYGSLTLFGTSMSLDSTMVDVAGNRTAISVFEQGRGMDDVIPRVNAFAQEINEKIFGRKDDKEERVALQTAPAAPSIYAHPERLLEEGMPAPDTLGQSGPSAAGKPQQLFGKPTANVASSASVAFTKIKSFDFGAEGIAVADVDGDGLQETVIMGGGKISVYRYAQKRLAAVAEFDAKRHQSLLWVDAADINKNGKAEIFVTAVSGGSKALESFVLEYDGSKLVTIAQKERWYFRVLDHPVRGQLLIGQRRGTSDLFLPGISELVPSGDSYSREKKVAVPNSVVVLGLTLADIMDDDTVRGVAFDKQDRLRVYTSTGKQEWESDQRYGGTEKFLVKPGTSDDEKGVFLPQRLIALYTDKSGQQKLVTVVNEGTTGRVFARYRDYGTSWFQCLAWDGLGLSPVWQTKKLSGYTTDYAVGDFDNDGQSEMLGLVMQNKVSFLKKKTSALISYELGQLF